MSREKIPKWSSILPTSTFILAIQLSASNKLRIDFQVNFKKTFKFKNLFLQQQTHFFKLSMFFYMWFSNNNFIIKTKNFLFLERTRESFVFRYKDLYPLTLIRWMSCIISALNLDLGNHNLFFNSNPFFCICQRLISVNVFTEFMIRINNYF